MIIKRSMDELKSKILIFSDLNSYSFNYDKLNKNIDIFLAKDKIFSELVEEDYELILLDGTLDFISECLVCLKSINAESLSLKNIIVCSKYSEKLNKLAQRISEFNIDTIIKPCSAEYIASKISFYSSYRSSKLEKAYEELTSLKRKLEMREKGIKKTDEAIKILYGEILKSNEIAANAIKCKSDFLTNMSHEIRTPLNAITGMIHLAMQLELSPKLSDYLKKIDNAGKLLLNIVNDILDFSKIEAGKLNIESVKFNLYDIFENLSNVIICKASENKDLEVVFDIEPDINPHLVGDPLRIEQILVNLANNAIKFTDSGSINVKAEILDEDKKNIRILFSVKDTGIGITEEQKEKLFDAFVQADTSTTRKYGGTGLGLSICKQLVELMDGKISVESNYGEGSNFRFELNLEKQFDINNLSELNKFKDKCSCYCVLIIAGNELSNAVLKKFLLSLNISFEIISLCEEVSLNIDKNKKFDLIIIDIDREFTSLAKVEKNIRDIRKYNISSKISLMIYSNTENSSKVVKKLNADYLLEKPVLYRPFLIVLGKCFGLKELVPLVEDENKEEYESLENIEGADILLVEDNNINQEIAVNILQAANLNITVANNGSEAVDIIKSNHFDLILMDIQMPVMDGLEATQIIRANNSKHISNIPIIGMTAHAFASYKEECLNKGMNDYITKPIQINALNKALLKWIPRKNFESKFKPNKSNCIEKENVYDSIRINIAGIETDSGINRIGGNKELYFSLLKKFKDGYSDVRSKLITAVNCNSVKDIESIAHVIAGVSGNLGASELCRSALQLEHDIRNNSRELLNSKLDGFYRNLDVVLKGIETFFNNPTYNNGKSDIIKERKKGKLDLLLEQVLEFEKYLKKRIPKSCKSIIKDIELYDWPDAIDEKFEALKKYTIRYKFKDAESALNDLIDTIKLEIEMERKYD